MSIKKIGTSKTENAGGTEKMEQNAEVMTNGTVETTTENQAEHTNTNVQNEVQVETKNERDDEIAELKRQIQELVQAQKESKTTIQQDQIVEVMYIDAVSPNNELNLGDFGSIRGSFGFIEVPRKDFVSKFMTPQVRWLIEQKRLIVTNGLTADEMKRYGLDFKDGEILTIETMDKLLDMKLDDLCSVFSKLCIEHKQLVATRFISLYFKNHDNRIGRTKVEKLNDLSRIEGMDGMFRPILVDMNGKV